MAKPAAASRPEMPESYRIPKNSEGLLAWNHVDERMSGSRNYWVATSRPDGRPHAMPVWGLWVDQAFYFATDRNSRKGRNLRENPAVAVHLESGDEVVVVEGKATEVASPERLSAIDDAYFAKYGMRVTDHPGAPIIYQVSPSVVFAWREKDFPASATRWRFPGE